MCIRMTNRRGKSANAFLEKKKRKQRNTYNCMCVYFFSYRSIAIVAYANVHPVSDAFVVEHETWTRPNIRSLSIILILSARVILF